MDYILGLAIYLYFKSQDLHGYNDNVNHIHLDMVQDNTRTP